MSTTNKSALASSFTLAAAGACLIDMMEPGTIKLWVGETEPAANIGAYHVIGYNEGGFAYTGTENVWIMANTGGTQLCVVTAVI